MKSDNFALILSRLGFKGYTTSANYYQITGRDTDFNPDDMITIRACRIDLEAMCEMIQVAAVTRIIKLPASASNPDKKIVIALWVNLCS